MTFDELGLAPALLRALVALEYTTPTPIQAQAIPPLLAGRDVLGLAQTGTGKTAAFALPILQKLSTGERRAAPGTTRALILTPTRELAQQIAQSFLDMGRGLRLRMAVIFGGVGHGPQIQALARGCDILVATPGRLLDHYGAGRIRFDQVEVFVLDEADRMLDMGFIRDVKRIVGGLPRDRQTLLFSATLPESVGDLASSLLRDPERVSVAPSATTAERVEQRVMFVAKDDKRHLLTDLFKDQTFSRSIIFTRTKHGANRVAEHLEKAGVAAEAIHGNKSQNAREKALASFRAGRVRALVATDIASRGIDVEGVTHVINFDMPIEPEAYVHRIGRTARAGREGIALSFCDAEELTSLRAIERTIRQAVPVDSAHAYHAADIANRGQRRPPQRSGGGGYGGGGGGGRQHYGR